MKIENVPPYGWDIALHLQVGRNTIYPGTEVSIRGERGRFRFVKHVKTPNFEWVDVIGGPRGVTEWRSFRPDQIKTVHRTKTTDKAVAAVRAATRKAVL